MAITWTENADSRVNLGPNVAEQESIASFATSDYTTGGYAVAAGWFGMGRIRSMVQVATTVPALGVVWQFDTTNKKLLAYWSGASGTALLQVPASTDLSGTRVTFRASGF